MVKPKGDKQVEYLDLDLDSGKSTPPRKVSRSSTLVGFLPSNFVASSCWGRGSLLNCPTVHLFVRQCRRACIGLFRETCGCSISVWDTYLYFVVNLF